MDSAEAFKDCFEWAFETEFGWTASRVLEEMWLPDTDSHYAFLAPTSGLLALSGPQSDPEADFDPFEELNKKPLLLPTDMGSDILREALVREQVDILIAGLGVPGSDGAAHPASRSEICDIVEHAVDSLGPGGFGFFLLPSWFLVAEEARQTRARLLEAGQVIELIDFPLRREPFERSKGGQRACFLQLAVSDDSATLETMVYRFAGKSDEDFQEFHLDIAMGAVWKWGFRRGIDQIDSWSVTALRPTLGAAKEETQKRLAQDDGQADPYWIVADIEHSLFDLVRTRLMATFGDNWWFEGVPREIRQKAALRHEENATNDPKEIFMDLLDLPKIISKNWTLFANAFPSRMTAKALVSQLNRIAEVRNRVMHPMRVRHKPVTGEELQMLREFRATF